VPTLTTVSTMLDAVMNDLRIPITNTTERAKIQAQMSYVYGDICAKQDWWWLQRRTVINTSPKIDTGTVNVTENSTGVTFSTAPQQFSANVSVAGYVLIIQGNATDSNAVYRITSHTSGATAATLDAAYTGTTDTAATFKMYQVSYDLPAGCGKLLYVKRFGYPERLRRVGIEDLSYLQGFDQSEGKPQVYSIFDFATNNTVSSVRELQLHPYPDRNYRLEVWYKLQQAGDLSDMALPVDYQQVLNYGTLSRCYPIFLNDTERGKVYTDLFNDVMALMSAQQREYASDHPGINPSADLYRNRNGRRRWPYTLGNLFDTLPNNP